MKIIDHNLMRRVQSVLATGLVLGSVFAATAQTFSLPPQTNLFRMSSIYPAGTAAPYNLSGGGIPAQSLITSPAPTATNQTLSWYGMQGWYTVLGGTSALGVTNPVTSVEASDFAWTTTVPIPYTTNNYSFFQISQSNYYAGSDMCSSCHGDKYTPYLKTRHAGAYTDPYALANFTTNCLTVGYHQPTGFWDTNANLVNVGCENCHGPAGWHKNTDHNYILPAVSQDPTICGSCHQGPLHPTFQEYTNVNYAAVSNAPMGVLVANVDHNTGNHTGGCSYCHAANNRMVMVKEYYDMKAGYPHPLTLFINTNTAGVKFAGAFGAAACATCHDPHSSNNVAQLRYPISSTNYYYMPPLLFTTPSVVTNYDGTFTTNTLTMNYVFDQIFNPKVQVCGQCHSGGGGIGGNGPRWNGSANGYVTNSVTTNVTTTAYYDITTTVTNVQVFTNTFYVYITTNASGIQQVFTNLNTIYTNGTVQVYDSYGNLYTNGLVQVITNSLPIATNTYTYTTVTGRGSYVTNYLATNQVIGVGIYYPLIAYTNVIPGVSTNLAWSTNSAGDYAPHYPVQYNVLIGNLNDDLAANGGPSNVSNDPHTLAPNQCADCHVPSYNTVNAGITNYVTGHTFVNDYNSPGCLASACHASYTNNPTGLATKTLNSKIAVSNSIVRVVSLLKQWGMATNVAPNILRTNYGTCAWEYASPSSYFGAKSTNVIGGVTYKYLVGPPAAYKPTLGNVPSGTNDNLQLAYVPQDIRIARFSLYWIYEDQSYGVHNPTYVKSLLADAENRVMNQFITNGYPAAFAASATSGTNTLNNVQFTNYGSGSVYSWTFGDGGTTNIANPTHSYTNGLWSVTCTVDGSSLTRTNYIWVH